MIVSIFEQNGTAVGFKKFTNNRLVAELYFAPEGSTDVIATHTSFLAKPGLEPEELLGLFRPIAKRNNPSSNGPEYLYCYQFPTGVSPVVYRNIYREGLVAFNVIAEDIFQAMDKTSVSIYDNVTGRIMGYSKGEQEAFDAFLEYRERVRKGEIVDEH